jgi:chromate transporter
LSIAAALSAITAAVVGVVLNLAVWFGLHVSFSEIKYETIYYLILPIPDFETINIVSVGLTVLAGILLLFLKQGVFRTLCICTLASIMVMIAS